MSGYLLLGVGFTGVLLLLAGLYGRRVSDALFCRRCGFELSGLSPNVCPECGRSLAKLWAVRQGRRRARRLPVAAGLFVLCGALIGGGVLGYSTWSGVPINRFKPTWLLMLEVQGLHVEDAEAAAAELVRRELNDRLWGWQRERLLAFALERHAQTEKDWLGDLDPVIARAFFEARLTREQVEAYLRNLATPSLVYTPAEAVWPGDVFRVDCQVIWRSGSWQAGEFYRWAFRPSAVLEQESVERVGTPIGFIPHDGVRTFRAGHFRAADEPGVHQLRRPQRGMGRSPRHRKRYRM